MRNTAVVALVVISLSLGFVIGRLTGSPRPGESDRPMASASPALATWDGGAFTAAELEVELAQLGPQGGARYRDETARLELVQSLARTSLFAHHARQLGLDKRSEVVRALRDELAGQLIKQRFEATLVTQPAAAEIEAFYRAHPERFSEADSIRAAHILLDTKEEAQALLATVTKKTASDYYAFSDAAIAKSKDAATRARGGELPAMTARQLEETLGVEAVQVLQKLAPDSIAPAPVQTVRGFHLLRLLDARPATTSPLDTVRENIAERLREEKRAAAWTKFTAELEASFGLSVDRAAVRAFVPK